MMVTMTCWLHVPYLVRQLSVNRLQFLAVWTGRRVKLDQNIFFRIVDHGIKRLSNNHLQHITGQNQTHNACSVIGSQAYTVQVKPSDHTVHRQTHLDNIRVSLGHRFRLHVTFETICKEVIQKPLQGLPIPPETHTSSDDEELTT